MSKTNLYIRDKYSGRIHRIGDNRHDMLYVDEKGTVHYQNFQNGDGCAGYKSVNRETLKDKYPDRGWKDRENVYVNGYEFVPNMDEYGYPINPTEDDREGRVMTCQEKLDYIREHIGMAAAYEQLAEECAEFAKAALKKARILRDDNPTPITEEEADAMVLEEYSDVMNCAEFLELRFNPDQAMCKLDRWIERI